MYRFVFMVLVTFSFSNNCSSSFASDGAEYENAKISISVQESREIGKDLIRANLIVSATGPDWTKINDSVESITAKLRKELSDFSNIKMTLGNRVTGLAIDNKVESQHKNWKVDQDIILSAQTPVGFYEFLQKSRDGVIVAEINYSVSPGLQRKMENEVTSLSLKRFHEKAKNIQENVGISSFDVIEMKITTNTISRKIQPYTRTDENSGLKVASPSKRSIVTSPSNTAIVSSVVSAVIELRECSRCR